MVREGERGEQETVVARQLLEPQPEVAVGHAHGAHLRDDLVMGDLDRELEPAVGDDCVEPLYGPEMRVIQLLRSPSKARIVAPETTVVPPRPTILSVAARPDGPREATRRRRKRPRV